MSSESDRRKVLVEMTDEGQATTWECYGPLVAEGQQILASLSREQLAQMRDHLDAIRALTDEHRDRLST